MSQPSSDPIKIPFFAEPSHRRWWLLCKAVECLPLDRAVELARSADEFVTGVHGTAQVAEPMERMQTAADLPEANTMATEQPAADSPPGVKPVAPKPNGLRLSREMREELLDRLAKGAKNSELAGRFGLSRQQVQGIRMGSAREIASRRERFGEAAREPSQPSETMLPATIDDVVRFLRQQDDVVVPEGNNFLLNGRFHLSLQDLISRANRIRSRQHKPEFELIDHQPACMEHADASANGHPLFWKDGNKTGSTSVRTSPILDC